MQHQQPQLLSRTIGHVNATEELSTATNMNGNNDSIVISAIGMGRPFAEGGASMSARKRRFAETPEAMTGILLRAREITGDALAA